MGLFYICNNLIIAPSNNPEEKEEINLSTEIENMKETIAHLKRGERGIIENFSGEVVPVKLQEMGCLPGNQVQLILLSPLKDLMYLNINDSHFAIRIETAAMIEIKKVG